MAKHICISFEIAQATNMYIIVQKRPIPRAMQEQIVEINPFTRMWFTLSWFDITVHDYIKSDISTNNYYK